MNTKPKDLTAIRIDGDLVDSLKRISEQEPKGFYSDRSVNWLITQAVREFIERNVAKPSQPPTHSA